MPLYTDIDLSQVTIQQRDSVMNSMGLFYPQNLNDVQYNLYDQFFSLMMDCLVHLVYSPQEIFQQFQQFQAASESQQARALVVYDKEVQKTIRDREFGEVLHGEEMAVNVIENAMRNLPIEARPAFLFTLANHVEPPINFNQENYPDYFNVITDSEISTQSDERLQDILALQAKRNSANPGYNKVITPEGFAQIVNPQAANPQPYYEQTRPRVVAPPSNQQPNPQYSQPIQPVQNNQNQPRPMYNTPQSQNIPQPSSRNKSLNDLLNK